MAFLGLPSHERGSGRLPNASKPSATERSRKIGKPFLGFGGDNFVVCTLFLPVLGGIIPLITSGLFCSLFVPRFLPSFSMCGVFSFVFFSGVGGEEGAEAVDFVLLATPAEYFVFFCAPFEAVAELEGLVAFAIVGVVHVVFRVG